MYLNYSVPGVYKNYRFMKFGREVIPGLMGASTVITLVTV